MSTFGTYFRVTTFGESHCRSVGCIVDGCPPGLQLTEADIQVQLQRRRPGQSTISTPRNEQDKVAIQSGTEKSITLGTPIALSVTNHDYRPQDYSETYDYPRPSHSDYTYISKYGIKASSGGGRSSARETIGRVCAGSISEKYMKEAYNIEIVAFVWSVGSISMDINYKSLDAKSVYSDEFSELLQQVTREAVDKTAIRCPNTELAQKMISHLEEVRDEKDSIGGTVMCVIRNCIAGLGEPCFDKLEAKLAHAMLSIPATKGFEIGSGFAGTSIPGSSHNDVFIQKATNLSTKTNNSGGVQGGISNGENIYFKVAFKSPATIGKQQFTSNYEGKNGILEAKGRHDPCVVARAVPIVESMAAIVLMDALLAQNARTCTANRLNYK